MRYVLTDEVSCVYVSIVISCCYCFGSQGTDLWKDLKITDEAMRVRLHALLKQIKHGPIANRSDGQSDGSRDSPAVEASASVESPADPTSRNLFMSPTRGKKASSHASQIYGNNVQVKGSRANEPSPGVVDAEWAKLGDLSGLDAKKEFLTTLCTVAPYWRYDQFI
jgi:hypothetical protein